MYQFSLAAFLRLFQRNLERTEVTRFDWNDRAPSVFECSFSERFISGSNSRLGKESTSSGLRIHHSIAVQIRSADVRHAFSARDVSEENSRERKMPLFCLLIRLTLT